jgi:zinc transport system substrate-binding protein
MKHLGLAIMTIALVAIGCGAPEQPGGPTASPDPGASALSVFVVNYPLAYFAERIGDDLVTVAFPAPPDGDPAFWSPDAETVAAYQEADLILLNGAGYAAWVDRVTLPPSKLIDTSAGFRDRYIFVDDAVTHSHGPEGDHSHGEAAFTTWLDPTLAVEHAAAVRDAFVAARPEHEANFVKGFESLKADLLAVDADLERVTAGLSETPLLGSHPVYQYLARRYGLSLRSVHFEPDEDPGPEGWEALDGILSEHPAGWMLWEDKPAATTEAGLERRGVSSVVYVPCGNAPEEGDLLTVLRDNLANLERAFASRTDVGS